jgi:hypothetical protein
MSAEDSKKDPSYSLIRSLLEESGLADDQLERTTEVFLENEVNDEASFFGLSGELLASKELGLSYVSMKIRN